MEAKSEVLQLLQRDLIVILVEHFRYDLDIVAARQLARLQLVHELLPLDVHLRRVEVLASLLATRPRLEGTGCSILLVELPIAAFTFIATAHPGVLLIMTLGAGPLVILLVLLLEEIREGALLEEDLLQRPPHRLHSDLGGCRVQLEPLMVLRHDERLLQMPLQLRSLVFATMVVLFFIFEIDLANNQVIAWASRDAYSLVLSLAELELDLLRPLQLRLEAPLPLRDLVRQLPFIVLAPDVQPIELPAMNIILRLADEG